MSRRKKAVLNWSGGKDCNFALHVLKQRQDIDIAALLTSVNTSTDRISMHGVRRSLLMKQSEAVGIPLNTLEIPEVISMDDYDLLMNEKMKELQFHGITHSVFGDIFLEDLRVYRENRLAEVNIEGVFPLWKQNTLELASDFMDAGFKAIIVCVDANKLNKDFVGREFDRSFILDLPKEVDPCGENGEFHSFVYDGPTFNFPVDFTVGEKVLKEYPGEKTGIGSHAFWYCDLKPFSISG